MSAWIVIILAGVATFLTRASFLLLGDRFTLPPGIQRALRYVAPAAFAGITIPAIVGDDGVGGSIPPDARLIAATIGLLVVWKTRSLTACVAIGMASLWLLEAMGL